MSASMILVVLAADMIAIVSALFLIREVFRLRFVPPFIRTRTAVTQEIAAHIGVLPEGSVMYDLGCGDGRVLRAIAERNPEAKLVGIEMRLLPFLMARHSSRTFKRISFIRANFFACNLSEATHVYAYLFTNVMNDLLPKLEQELAPGTMLYSLDFAFANKEPVEQFVMESARQNKLGRTLYVYRF